eukprot:963288-Ditylum_brightwellii.AAC.1
MNTTANALKHLKHQIIQQEFICVISPGSPTTMHTCHFTWPSRNDPCNFTVCHTASKNKNMDMVNLAVNRAEEKGPSKFQLSKALPSNVLCHMIGNM